MQTKKLPNTSDLVKKADLNAKVTEIESKIPNISGLATNFTLTSVGNKMPDVSSLVKKTDLNSKITEVESKIPSITDFTTNSALTAVESY